MQAIDKGQRSVWGKGGHARTNERPLRRSWKSKARRLKCTDHKTVVLQSRSRFGKQDKTRWDEQARVCRVREMGPILPAFQRWRAGDFYKTGWKSARTKRQQGNSTESKARKRSQWMRFLAGDRPRGVVRKGGSGTSENTGRVKYFEARRRVQDRRVKAGRLMSAS